MTHWSATEAQAERAIATLKRMIDGAQNSNQAAENAVVIAAAFARHSLEDLEEELDELLSDSIDLGWSTRDGARAIVRRTVEGFSA
jgi:hypothetical protein